MFFSTEEFAELRTKEHVENCAKKLAADSSLKMVYFIVYIK